MPPNRTGRRTARASQTSGRLEVAGYRGEGVYPVNLEPFARPGDHVELRPHGEVYQVEVMEVVPAIDVFDTDASNNFSVAANDVESDKDAIELEMRDGMLGQLRMVRPNNDLDTGLEVSLDQGGSQAPMWTTKRFRGYIDENISDYTDISSVNEIYVWQDETPKFTFTNTTGGSLDVADIRFAGFVFHLESTSPPPDVHVEPVPVESLRKQRG